MTLEPNRGQARSDRARGFGRHRTLSGTCHGARVASNTGARAASIAAMKKLLLLVVIAALATIATKKVRAA